MSTPFPLLRMVALIILLALPGGITVLALWAGGAIGLFGLGFGLLAVAASAAALGWLVQREALALSHVLQGPDSAVEMPVRFGPIARLIGAGPALDQLNRVLRGRVAGRRAAEAILQGLPIPLLLLDAERRVIRLNRAAGDLVGAGGVGRDLTASLRHPALVQAVDAVLAGEAARDLEFSLAVPVERHFAAHVGRMTAELPDIAAILTLNETTMARRAEQMRADFVANASHELRTPLATLLGFVETLRGPARDDEPARERFLAIMHDQAQRMARLVNDLLSLSRIELFEHSPPTGEADLAETLRGVVDALKPQARERQMQLLLEVADGLPGAIGDEDQLAQVFQNLVVNAIKYARAGTTVTVRAWHAHSSPSLVGGSAGAVAVAVIDRGDGIERRHLPRLTERFYRIDAARSRQLGGTGLGLAIVKHIVSRHRGALTIESEVGEGSVFTVYLPAITRQIPAPASGDNTPALP
jgi:two-component system phosphate regulon sensor histidine kinase PhoR